MGGLFRFASETEAVAKLADISAAFEMSTKLPIKQDVATPVLWIKGYEVSNDEADAGYLGQFAKLTIAKVGDRWAILAEKQVVDLQFHPQKKRPKARHPDWGHPILKEIKKGRVYPNVGVAERELMRLHEAYSATSIPTGPELYIMIYEKASTPSVQKYILAIEPHKEGGVTIAARRNVPDKRAVKPDETQGEFAAKVAITKSRKVSKANYLKEKDEHSN